MGYHFVLVHGTGACGAPWTREADSSLCAHLKAVLHEPSVFTHADWSGRNTHPARAEGARKLIDHVNREVTADRALVLVGHSHGGTVIAQALVADADLCRRVAGVVFLSTPFLQARLLPLANHQRKGLAVIAGVVCAIGLLLGIILLAAVAGWGKSRSPWLDGLVWGGMLAGAVTWAVVFDHVSRWLGTGDGKLNDAETQAVARLLGQLDLGALDQRGLGQRSLLVRSTADEAAGALATAQLLGRIASDLPALVWKAPGWAARKLLAVTGFKGKEPPRWFVGLLFAGMLLGFIGACVALAAWLVPGWGPVHAVDEALRGGADRVIGAGARFLVLLIWVVVSVWCTAGVLLVLGVPFKLLSLLAYGLRGWPALRAMFVEVSVEPAPPGTWRLHQLDANGFELAMAASTASTQGAAPASGETAWAHSYVYDDARAHRVIAEWLSDRSGVSRRTAAATRPDG